MIFILNVIIYGIPMAGREKDKNINKIILVVRAGPRYINRAA